MELAFEATPRLKHEAIWWVSILLVVELAFEDDYSAQGAEMDYVSILLVVELAFEVHMAKG